MAPDSFLLQLLAFVAAQAAGWGNMLTGRFRLGFVQFAAAWLLADTALLLRLVAEESGALYATTLVALQLLAVGSLGELVLRRSLRARPAFRSEQDAGFAAALDAFMAGRDADAVRGFRRLWRRDPWDAEAAAMLATLMADAGRGKAASRWFRRARARTRSDALRLGIEEDVRCLQKTRVPRPMPPRSQAALAAPAPRRPAAVG